MSQCCRTQAWHHLLLLIFLLILSVAGIIHYLIWLLTEFQCLRQFLRADFLYLLGKLMTNCDHMLYNLKKIEHHVLFSIDSSCISIVFAADESPVLSLLIVDSFPLPPLCTGLINMFLSSSNNKLYILSLLLNVSYFPCSLFDDSVCLRSVRLEMRCIYYSRWLWKVSKVCLCPLSH